MTTHDIHNRPYARLSTLKPGDKVIVDDGFTCMKRWSEREVRANDDGSVGWLRCTYNGHGLEGQLDFDDDDILIGIYRKEDFVPNPGDKK